jgi:hypothetical protein
MVHRRGPGQAWQLLQTSRTGNDVYGSVLPEAGQYALVYSKRAQPSEVGFAGVAGSGILGGHLVLVVVALLTLLVLISVVLAVRWRGSNVDP